MTTEKLYSRKEGKGSRMSWEEIEAEAKAEIEAETKEAADKTLRLMHKQAAKIRARAVPWKHGHITCLVNPELSKEEYWITSVQRRPITASRLIYCVHTGKPMDHKDADGIRLDACHKTPYCQSHNCVNTVHLFWDTYIKNQEKRGREIQARKLAADTASKLKKSIL
jgi:hypothetical protein